MKKVPAPWIPAKWEEADAYAIQALAQGNASETQQIRALRFIVEELCAAYDNPYKPDSDRDTAFACGKKFVAEQIIKFTKVNINKLKENNA